MLTIFQPGYNSTHTLSDAGSFTDAQEQLNLPKAAFPPYADCAELVNRSSELPDIVFIDFEHAVEHEKLQGWEDEWISSGTYDADKWGNFSEPLIDFVYTWVNGSEQAFRSTKDFYADNSTLKDELQRSSGANRYRDWEELRYSIRSVEKFAPFRNNIQLLVNTVHNDDTGESYRQVPGWLSQRSKVRERVHVLSQEDFFASDRRGCLPTFNSMTMENQIYNTHSDVDRVFALSDDMLLGKPHASSDFYSPLYGTTMSFKTNAYNTRTTPSEGDAHRFGEKPWLIYTSWLLNRRFGERKRRGQAHFGHSLSRSTMREALESFPRPNLQSASSRFRGDIQSDVSGFQLYAWYVYFHYTIERHREALLWSYLTLRADDDGDGTLSWPERQSVLEELREGMDRVDTPRNRYRHFYHVPQTLEAAGLKGPKVTSEVLWTSMDGPVMMKEADCTEFDVNECLAPGFSMVSNEPAHRNPFFSASVIFERVAHQMPQCGDCLVKILLHRRARGLEPLLPKKDKKSKEREMIVKVLMKYQYTVVEPDALFVMVTDAEQVETTLINRFVQKHNRVGQLCLNDDVSTEDERELEDTRNAMTALYRGMFPERSPYEKKSWA